MILSLPDEITTWEGVALIQVAQAAIKAGACKGTTIAKDLDVQRMLGAANIPQFDLANEALHIPDGENILQAHDKIESVKVAFAEAYRKVDQGKSYYGDVLAECSGLFGLKLEYPRFPHQVTRHNGVVLAIRGVKSDLELPDQVWRAIIKQMRSYGEPVYLIGDNQKQRFDAAGFPECAMYLDCSLDQKLQLLADAKLVLGVPNAWMWIAAGMTKTLVLYPDGMPNKRWFPWETDMHGRLVYQPSMLQIPVVLAGLRKLINNL